MSATLQVPEKAARKLVRESGFSDAEDTSAKKLQSRILKAINNLNGESIEEKDLTSRSKSLMEEIAEALDDEREILIGDEEVEDEEAEEEEAPKKRRGRKPKEVKVKTQRKSKTAKKGKGKKSPSAGRERSSHAGGKTDKDLVFLEWLKNPTASPKKVADKMASRVQNAKDTTISHWVSDFKRGGKSVGFPRVHKEHLKDIKKALALVKADR